MYRIRITDWLCFVRMHTVAEIKQNFSGGVRTHVRFLLLPNDKYGHTPDLTDPKSEDQGGYASYINDL